MVGAQSGDMARIKDFISRTNDYGVRLVYKHGTEPSAQALHHDRDG